jgi:hypothetical protein
LLICRGLYFIFLLRLVESTDAEQEGSMKRNAYSSADLTGEPDLGALLDEWQEIMPRLRKALAAHNKAIRALRPPPHNPELTVTTEDKHLFRPGAWPVGERWDAEEISRLEHLLKIAKQSRGGDTSGRLFARGEAILAARRDWLAAMKEARREVDETQWQLMHIEDERDAAWARFARTPARTAAGVILKAQVAVGCSTHLGAVFDNLHLSIARDLRKLGTPSPTAL